MKLLTIIKKEYREIVRKKSFIISTILTPVLMGGMMFIPVLLMKVGRPEKTIAVADYSGGIYQKLVEFNRKKPEAAGQGKKIDNNQAMKKPTLDNEESKIRFQPVNVLGTPPSGIVKEYERKILTKEVDGFLLIPADVIRTRKTSFFANNISDFATNQFITSTIRTIISQQLLLGMKIDPAVVIDATRDIELDTFKVKKEGTTKSSSGLDYVMSLFMMIILFAILIGYGQMILRGVLEEKNSRIVEILLSSTKTTNLFFGKILGIGFAGLTQVGIWILFAAALIGKFSYTLDNSIINFLTPEIALYFVIFFILGFFLYAILFSIVGASVNTDQEAQQFSAIITWTMLIPYFIGISVTQNPNSTLATIASLIPLFTPILMFMRITGSMPSTFQIWISIAATSLTIYLMAWVGAKIFRVGILMYGKKPSLKEIFRWISYK
jgi:ABC-2 type transport system permease protein